MDEHYVPVTRISHEEVSIYIDGVDTGLKVPEDDTSDPTPNHEYLEIERKPGHLLSYQSYIWDNNPQPGGPVLHLESVKVVTTYHSWGFQGHFKPSIYEVMAFAQHEDIPDDATYYWLQFIDGDRSKGPILFKPDDQSRSGYHRAFVHFMRVSN